MRILFMKKLFQKQIIFLVILIAFFVCGISVLAIDCSEKKGAEKTKCELQNTAGQGYLNGPQEIKEGETKGIITSIPGSVGKIVGAGLSLLGVLFLLLIIYGGIVWMIARGNEQEVQKAKTVIEAAVIGLVIVLAAYAITYFIGSQLTG